MRIKIYGTINADGGDTVEWNDTGDLMVFGYYQWERDEWFNDFPPFPDDIECLPPESYDRQLWAEWEGRCEDES